MKSARTQARIRRAGSAAGTGYGPGNSPVPFRAGLTERLAAASARRPWRTIGWWGAATVVSLILAITMLHGLATTGNVIGTPQSSCPAGWTGCPGWRWNRLRPARLSRYQPDRLQPDRSEPR